MPRRRTRVATGQRVLVRYGRLGLYGEVVEGEPLDEMGVLEAVGGMTTARRGIQTRGEVPDSRVAHAAFGRGRWP